MRVLVLLCYCVMSLFNLHGLFPRKRGKDVVNLVDQKHQKKNEVVISSMCET
uniref:Uncharacterized protein n=1 Tax=Helianthus annuus TaxID=4232 RepID=A0A251TUU9_HELAN